MNHPPQTQPLLPGERLEPLSRSVSVIVNSSHTFNTDTILLARFSRPRRGEFCADFGSGCGAIPLLWCSGAEPALVYAVEIQENACSLLSRSVSRNGLGQKICVVDSDIKELPSSGIVPRDLDRIACNPPYQPIGAGHASVVESERIARHEVACSFSDVTASASALLRWGGSFFCCMRPDRLCDTMLQLHAAGLEPKRLRLVQQRKGKAPFLALIQAKRGGRPGVSIDPVLLVEADGGGWSAEMLEIYGDYKENHRCREN